MVIGSILNLLVTSYSPGGSIILIANLLLAIFIIENIEKLYSHALIFVITVLIFISYKIFYLKIPPNQFYENFSQNIVGYFVVASTIYYSFIVYVKKNRVNVIIPLFAFIVSIFLVGRSTLGVLMLLLLISIIFNIRGLPLYLSVSIIVLLTILVIKISGNSSLIELYFETGFAKKGLDSPRFMIWEAYFKDISFYEIILGRDPNSVLLIEFWDGNLHNSFLKLHSRMGLAIFVFFWYIVISIKEYTIHKQYYLLFLLILLTTRLFFDSMNFIGSLDFIYFTILLYPLNKFNNRDIGDINQYNPDHI